MYINLYIKCGNINMLITHDNIKYVWIITEKVVFS